MEMINEIAEVDKKSGMEKKKKYEFERENISNEAMMNIESIGRDISETISKSKLSIIDVKTLLPYLAAYTFIESGESDVDIVDYIENYFTPAVFEYMKEIRNNKKFVPID